MARGFSPPKGITPKRNQPEYKESKKRTSKPNAHTTIGKNKIEFAKHGRGAMGERLTSSDRKKLIRSGIKDQIKGAKLSAKKHRAKVTKEANLRGLATDVKYALAKSRTKKRK